MGDTVTWPLVLLGDGLVKLPKRTNDVQKQPLGRFDTWPFVSNLLSQRMELTNPTGRKKQLQRCAVPERPTSCAVQKASCRVCLAQQHRLTSAIIKTNLGSTKHAPRVFEVGGLECIVPRNAWSGQCTIDVKPQSWRRGKSVREMPATKSIVSEVGCIKINPLSLWYRCHSIFAVTQYYTAQTLSLSSMDLRISFKILAASK